MILLLDEPTGDLDTKNTIQVMDLLLSINQKLKTTCLMVPPPSTIHHYHWHHHALRCSIHVTRAVQVTHNPDLECYADRVLYLQDGRFHRQALNTRQSPLRTPLVSSRLVSFVRDWLVDCTWLYLADEYVNWPRAEYDVYMEYLNQQQADLCELTDEDENDDAEPINFEEQLEAEAD